jgi:hypothetical protein
LQRDEHQVRQRDGARGHDARHALGVDQHDVEAGAPALDGFDDRVVGQPADDRDRSGAVRRPALDRTCHVSIENDDASAPLGKAESDDETERGLPCPALRIDD